MQERVKRILTDLETVRENLLALSDDIWLNIDHNDQEALEEGVQFKRAYNENMVAFDRSAADVSALIQQFTDVHVEVEDEIQERRKDSEDNKRRIRELDRQAPHSLEESFAFQRPYGFVLQGEAFTNIVTWRRLYELFCQRLARRDAARMTALPDNPAFRRRRGGHQFSRDQSPLLSPLSVANGVYAEGNMSANSIRDMMKRLLDEFDVTHDEMTIYLREDRDAPDA